MTTQNTPGKLTQRIILSMPYDPGGVQQANINSDNAAYEGLATGNEDNNVRQMTLTELTAVSDADWVGPKPVWTTTGGDATTNTGQLPVNHEIENHAHWQDFIPDTVMSKTMGSNTNKEN